MADTSATIIAASLNSDDLEKSINKLVKTVASKTKAMADNFTSEIARMEQAVRNLGNVRVNSSGSADGGSSKRASKQKEEEAQVKATTQAYKEQAATFDQQAASVKRASRGSTLGLKKELDEASNSYSNLIQQLQRTITHFDVSPIQSLRMRQHELEAGMRTASNEAAKAKKDVDELNAAITNYRSTLETLPKNQQGFSNRQSIQKEINDLIVLRDTASAEQQKWENAGRQLASQYEIVKLEIRQIGQALIAAEESEKRVTTELDKQLQKINEISSRKTATQAYRDAISMETGNLEKAEAKLTILKTIKEKILNTDLLSKKDTESLTSWITYTSSLVERMRAKSTKSTKEEEDAIRKAAEAEKRFEENIKTRGQIAQETSRKVIQMLNDEAQAGGKGLMGMFKIDGKDINAVRELEKAVKDMQMQYNKMSDTDKESAIGRALKRDIENARTAAGVVSAYNKRVLGFFDNTSISDSARIRNYETLKNVLKELTSQYNQVSIEEIKAGNANHIINAIQQTSREAQKLQSIMNRPTSFASAMKLSEKTLDDLSYKIRQLQSYRLGINLQNPNTANEIKQVDEAILKLQKDMDKYLSKSKDVLNSNNALSRSWNYMKNRLAFYFTVGASTQFIKNLIEVRSQYEMNERALGILINSAERGTQIFNELSQMALVSPYTLIELSSAAKQLTAYDVAAKDVVDTTRRLADMAAAVGIPIERLTYALGQIKAYGYLNSRDARMFANAGIPLVKQLSDYYTELEGRLVSTADVYDRIKKKSIDYNEVMEVMYKMTDQGGKFFDFQAKMADTLKVRLANLTLAWNNMLNDMGKESQGVLTWGIGALRDLFLRWKDLDKAIKKAAWLVGLKVAIDFLLFGLNRAGLALGMWTHKMALSEVVGKRLAITITAIGRSLYSLAASRMTWITLATMAAIELVQALYGANEAQIALNKSLRDGAKDNYNNISKFLEQYKQVRESLYTTQKVAIGNMYDPSTGKASATAYVEQSVEQDIDKNEAKKAWEAVREQIELTTRSSDQYIGRLLEISNMSERVRQGFNILEDVRTVNAALQELDEDTIKIEKDMSGWWNAYQLPDGLIGNIKDYQEELNKVVEKFGSLENLIKNVHVGGDNWGDFNDYQTALERLQSSVKTTTDSIINFIELKGWSGDINKINEVFKQIADKIALDNQLDPQKAFVLQTQVEEARSQAAKQALLQRIKDEEAALAQASDENQRKALTDSIKANVAEYNNWDNFNGRKKVEWERFTKWIKEQHISETTAMFRNMDAEDIKSLDFQEGKYNEYVNRMVEMYAKEHKMSYDEAFGHLKGWVTNANKWSIFIPLIISTEDKKSVYQQLQEYDKAVDSADSEIERLTTRIDELRKKKELEKEETEELVRAEQELTDAQKAKVDAESKGGHGKKEKKDEKASQKAAKKAESELAKALKDELKLIETVRSSYKDLTKEGASHADAVKKSVSGYEKSVANINKVLEKYGVKLDLTKFAGIANPHELQEMFNQQLNALAGKAKPTEIQALEVELKKVDLDVDKYDLTKITKGLNNELDRLKEEYELAVALDADPELGGIFANYMGINLEDLPKTAEEAAKKAQEYIDKILAENNSSEKIDISSLMDKKAFDSWVESSGHSLDDELVKAVSAFRGYLHKVNVDETKNQAQEWNKLLEKYAEYEYKVTQIQKEAEREREVARKKGASQDVFDAINNRERQEIARVGFEKFQKSPEWIAATGDLANMSKSAIGMLIEELERYKRTAKNLSPKEIKQLNNALSKLYKEQRKNNPFKAVVNMLDEAKERMSIFDEEIEETQKQIDELSKKHKTNLIDGIADDDTQKKLKEAKERLSKLKEERNNIGKIDASTWVSSINETISAVKSAIEVFDGLAKAIGGVENSDVDKVFSILDSAGKGASTGSAFGPYGAIIGGVVGAAAGVVNAFADVWSGNERINKSIEVSTQKVRALEREYKRLERAVDDAYGTDSIGAQRLMMLNKEAELAELERQLELEKSRKAKNKDQEKIDELRDKVDELRYEVNNAAREIILDLLEIGDAQDWANDFVKGMIDAFREGENYMKSYEDAFREMIDNMIAKTIAGKVIGERIEQMIANIKEIAKTRAEGDASVIAARDALDKLEKQRDVFYAFREGGENVPEEVFDQINKDIADAQKIYDEIYTKAVQPTPEDVQGIRESISSWKDDVKNEFDTFMEAFGVEFGSAKESQQLSALQQGLQGVSEETAGAVEAYLNGMSQQAYLRNELLTQIRDAIMGTNSDIQLGVQGQMLLQLQNNYIIMQSIQSMMEGWTTPSGQGIRVELIS